jgi:hypothetical protein
MTEGQFTALRRSRSNVISAALRKLSLSAEVKTPPRGDAGLTTVRAFDAADAAELEKAVRHSVGDAGRVELMIAVIWN